MRRHKLPSMTSLQVLLAVAERGYTTAAADSMNLSQSAVSKQLLALEAGIGQAVFTRTPNGMVPTAAGAIYIEHAQVAIKAMEDAALQVARLKPEPRALRLQVLPIFGDRWLLPNFSDFSDRHPDIDVQFTTFVSATQAEDADGIFTFGEAAPDGQDGQYLFGTDVLLVATPGYWRKLGEPRTIGELASATMLEHPQTPLHWRHFAESTGRPDAHPGHTVRFGYYTMVIRAALAGQGMALIPRGLILHDLASGRLSNPSGLGYRSRLAYWFSISAEKPVTEELSTFKTWLSDRLSAFPVDR